MKETLYVAIVVFLFVILFVLCAIWHHITAMRYRKIKTEKGKQYKWYQLFGKLNEIGFWVKFIAVVLLLLTLFVSLHYLCCTYPHKLTKTPDFDYMSVICTFFGVLVTLLVGWNIYNVVDYKKKLEKLEDDQNFVGECLLKSQKSAQNSQAYMFRFLSQSWAISLLANTPNKKLSMMIGYAISGIDSFLRNGDVNTANKALDELMDNVEKAKGTQLTATERKELIKLLDKISDASRLSKMDELRNYLN